MRLVIKIGGSLMSALPSVLSSLKQAHIAGLVVPGGAVFARLVREVDAAHHLAPHTSHMMALAAMEQYGHMMADIGDIRAVSAPTFDGLCVLLPYCMLANGDVVLPDESWSTTSDTIAACIAHEYGARACKLTDVDGILLNGEVVRRIDASRLTEMGSTCVDANLPRVLLETEMDFAVLSGLHPDRLVSFIKGEPFLGTVIMGR